MKVRPLVLIALLAGFTTTAASGQSGGDQDAAKGYRFSMAVDMVHLAVTAVNKKDRLVSDLIQEDFVVLENGVPQEVVFFSKGTDSPVDIFLLVDASGSMDMVDKVANARNAAIQLIHSLDPIDRVAVYAFDQDVMKLAGFTDDKQVAIRSLEKIEPFGATAIHDAVARASVIIEGEGFGRRAIVLITDGVDTASELSIAEAVDVARRVDLPVYAMRVLSPVDDPAHDLYLQDPSGEEKGMPARPDALAQFAEATGGRLYQGSELGTLRQIALQIKEELKTQYRIGYVPTNAARDGTFRRVEVRFKRKGVLARTRKGYFAKTSRRGEASTPAGERRPASH
jgi:VWFA-related protein